METSGNQFRCWVGMVNQLTLSSAGMGGLIPYKLQKADLDPVAGGHDTTANMSQFNASITTNRKTTIKLHGASWNPIPENDFAAVTHATNFDGVGGVPFILVEGMYIRLAIASTGVATASLNALVVANQAHLYPAVRITRLPQSYDANGGQPFDFEAETVFPYLKAGEANIPGGSPGNRPDASAVLAFFGTL
jgi:hypothetical protein